MTISDAAPQNRPPRASLLGHGNATPVILLPGVENSVDFVIGPEVVPSAALKQAEALARMALPRLLGDAVDASKTCDEVRAVLVELIDVTARHQASGSLVSRLAYDGAHVTVSVGDMDCLLPAPADEPGLYLVYRIADDVGQYAGDHGGRVTWAAVATRT